MLSLFHRDHAQLAAQHAREGRKDKALELYVKAGDYARAAAIAVELGDTPRAIDLYLKGTLGHTPEGYAGATPGQIGELLATSGFREEAIALFELGKDFRRAAEACLKLQQPGRAARYYERGRHWSEAAVYYERAGQLKDALRVLELEAKRLEPEEAARRDPAAGEKRRKVAVQRAEILAKLGRGAEGAELLGTGSPTLKAARLLEEAGRLAEAIEVYLQLGENDRAVALLARAPELDRRRAAEVYRRAGRPLEAAHLLTTLGRPREAAQAYEEGGDWARAAVRWEEAKEPLAAAHAYTRADRSRDAARCFTAAGKHPLAAAAHARAGDRAAAGAAYLKAGQPVDAARELLAAGGAGPRAEAARTLMQIPPGSPEAAAAALLLAPLLVEEGLFDDALRRLRGVPAGDIPAADLPDRLYWEGRSLAGLARAEEARRVYERLLALRPDHRDAAKRLADLAAGLAVGRTVQPPGGTAAGGPTAPTVRQAPYRAPPASSEEIAVGRRLAGRYDILSELGRGGMSQVYKARDAELDELVAVKTLKSGEEEERLLREVQICRRITHPNVVRVFDLGRFQGGIFVTMELLEGQRLDTLIDAERPLPLARVRAILAEIAAGLREAHGLGVIHRDLKPSNVILTAQRVKILDFGIARMAGIDSRLTQTGLVVGSPMYMSPEQLQGTALDGRTDLYSLGILAYALITGREPFLGASASAVALQHLQSPPPDPRRFRPDLPAAWPAFLDRLLAKRAADRYASAQEVLDALQALPDGAVTG
jgi:tetratricopeptide (TPR) repeat protein